MAKVIEMKGGWKSATDFNQQANYDRRVLRNGNGDGATQVAKFH
jgi:hypothetical protein